MTKRYLLAESTIDQDDLRDLGAWIAENPWLTQGPLVRAFEAEWARWLGRPHATFVNSGSSANLLMYAALLYGGKLRNRRVIVPAVSWSTTVAPAIQLGFEPIMCDADEKTFGLELGQLEDLVKKHDPAVVTCVHVLGVPNRMNELMALKQKHGFVLLEDSCAATGSRYEGKKVGTFGEIATFSFFFGHHLSTIEGGMISTSDPAIHEMLLLLRSHGWTKDVAPARADAMAKERGVADFNKPFTFYVPGFNVRSSDLNARIGLSQMKKADRVVERRRENHAEYRKAFASSADFHVQSCERSDISSISFCALARSPERRERVAAAVRAAHIETRPIGGGNMSRQPFWADRYGAQVFPMADRIHTTGFQLPNHPGLSLDDVRFIAKTALDAGGA
jgi:CDP-6-deoxy-D-xylo-4-hexulose-3-dehydrase